jgi:hypothetical protein
MAYSLLLQVLPVGTMRSTPVVLVTHPLYTVVDCAYAIVPPTNASRSTNGSQRIILLAIVRPSLAQDRCGRL